MGRFDFKASMLLGLLLLLMAPTLSRPAAAQSVFCPGATVNAAVNGFGPVVQSAGNCTNGLAGAFSGAALSSQALGDLAEGSSQMETGVATNAIAGRREASEASCPAGQKRENGTCVSEQPASSRSKKTEAETDATKSAMTKNTAAGSKKRRSKVATSPPKKNGTTNKVVRSRRSAEPEEVVVAPFDPAFSRGPNMIEGSFRFGTWAEGYGDYEHRSGTASSSIQCCTFAANTNPAIPLIITAKSDTATGGFVGGFDMTRRNILAPDDGLILGIMVGALSSHVTVNTNIISTIPSLLGNGSSSLSARLTGPSVGFYATYYRGAFSNDFLIKNDFLSLAETFNDSLAFGLCSCFAGTGNVPFNNANSGGANTHLNQITIADNVHYRVPLSGTTWIEPTFGLEYEDSLYDTSAAALGLSDGNRVRVQGGAKYGYLASLYGMPMTMSVTGLVFDDVVVSGNFIQGGVFGNTANILNDRGRVQGEGIFKGDVALGNGYSLYALADVRGGRDIFGVGGKIGARYQW